MTGFDAYSAPVTDWLGLGLVLTAVGAVGVGAAVLAYRWFRS